MEEVPSKKGRYFDESSTLGRYNVLLNRFDGPVHSSQDVPLKNKRKMNSLKLTPFKWKSLLNVRVNDPFGGEEHYE